jgi:hypothetical protein
LALTCVKFVAFAESYTYMFDSLLLVNAVIR